MSEQDILGSGPAPRRHRAAVIAGTTGLVAGLAIGVTGLATAASTPSPSPSPGTTSPGTTSPGTAPGTTAPAPPGAPRPQGHAYGHDGRPGPGGGGRGGALVSAVTADALTLRTPGGTRTVRLTSSTTYYDAETKATRSVLRAGEIVRVRLADPSATSPVATVVTVEPARLWGWVTAVDGGTVSLVDGSGFTRTVRTTDSTTYRSDGTAGSRSAVVVGARVRATGKVDSDGTTLDATLVEVGTALRPGGAGLPGGERPGRDGDVAPSASASPQA